MYKLLSVAIISAAALFAMGCSSDKKEAADNVAGTKAVAGSELQNNAVPTSQISSDDLAKALGITAFLVKLPERPSGTVEAGFTYVDINGPQGTGFSTFESGEVIKAMYWIDDDKLEYALIGKSSSTRSSVLMEDIKVFHKKASSPDHGKVYTVGEIAARWSRGSSMTHQGNVVPITTISSGDEIGFAVILQK